MYTTNGWSRRCVILCCCCCCCTKSGGLVRVMLPPGTFERMFICVHELSINRCSAHHAPYAERGIQQPYIHRRRCCVGCAMFACLGEVSFALLQTIYNTQVFMLQHTHTHTTHIALHRPGAHWRVRMLGVLGACLNDILRHHLCVWVCSLCWLRRLLTMTTPLYTLNACTGFPIQAK